MAKLIYASNLSLDGWTEDEHGALDWAPPDDDVFTFITEVMASAGTYLYGRRMYETMAVWETDPTLAARSELTATYARVWQAADKVVYSSTLAEPTTAKTRLERDFDPVAVQELKAAASHDLWSGARTSRPRRSPRDWSTSSCCSCGRWSSVASSRPSRPTCTPISSSSTSTGWAAASSTSATAWCRSPAHRTPCQVSGGLVG